MKSQYSKPEYVLGAADCFLFTGLGSFPTAEAAEDYAMRSPRVGVWYIYARCDVSRHGVVYGADIRIVKTVGA